MSSPIFVPRTKIPSSRCPEHAYIYLGRYSAFESIVRAQPSKLFRAAFVSRTATILCRRPRTGSHYVGLPIKQGIGACGSTRLDTHPQHPSTAPIHSTHPQHPSTTHIHDTSTAPIRDTLHNTSAAPIHDTHPRPTHPQWASSRARKSGSLSSSLLLLSKLTGFVASAKMRVWTCSSCVTAGGLVLRSSQSTSCVP